MLTENTAHPRPNRAFDQLGVPFAGGEPEADGQLHDHVEDRDQKDLEGRSR